MSKCLELMVERDVESWGWEMVLESSFEMWSCVSDV